MAHTHTNMLFLFEFFPAISLCFLTSYFCSPSQSHRASSQDLLYRLGSRTFPLFQWENVLVSFSTLGHFLWFVCVAETHVISQRTSVSSVSKGGEGCAKLCSWPGYDVCMCLCVYFMCICVWLFSSDELLLLHKSAPGSPAEDWECVYVHTSHACMFKTPFKSQIKIQVK